MDLMVLAAQQWVNATYAGRAGYVSCRETGSTGWGVMFSLTRALQIELGVTPPSDSFGPATTTALDTHGPITASTASVNLRKIVQASLYCKGYPGGGIDGIWGSSTASGIQGMKSDMGLGPGDASINTKVMKSLLTMDAYTVLWDGNQMVRAAQQWLNATFVSRRDFSILPCDGIFSRNVQRGIVYALQYSLGMTDGTANGVFGPATRSALNQRASLKVGTADSGPAHFVRIFKVDFEVPTLPGELPDIAHPRVEVFAPQHDPAQRSTRTETATRLDSVVNAAMAREAGLLN